MNLIGKVAVVTGASYGLGKDICDALLPLGYKVYGVSRTKPKINSKFFVWVKADLLDFDKLEAISSIIKESKIDLLINNAGTHIEESALDVSREVYNRVFELNFKSPIFLTKSLSSKLNNGFIINISSTSDRYAEKGSALYSASKAALQMFFNVLSLENKNIKVVNLLPDYIDTPLQHTISDGTDFDWNRCVRGKDIADFIIRLVSGNVIIKTGSNIIFINNKTQDDANDPEKLWCYNVDTKELKKLK